MPLILSWVLTLRISFVDGPLLALRGCCGVGMEDPEEVAIATVFALVTDGRLGLGAGMAEGEERWEKEEEDGLPPDRGAAIAAQDELR